MLRPAEQPRSRTANDSAGVGSRRVYSSERIPLAASTQAAMRENSRPLWRESRAMATEGFSKCALR